MPSSANIMVANNPPKAKSTERQIVKGIAVSPNMSVVIPRSAATRNLFSSFPQAKEIPRSARKTYVLLCLQFAADFLVLLHHPQHIAAKNFANVVIGVAFAH